jgi:hypothetical protein
MSSFDAAKVQLGAFRRLVRGVVRAFVLLALGAGIGVGLLGVLLAREGLDGAEAVFLVLLLGAPLVVLMFAAGLRTLLELPERVLRMPQRGAEQVDALTRIADDARTASWRHAPFLLWRSGSLVSSTRDLVRIAMPLRIFVPGFLWLTLAAVVVCVVLVAIGLIALVALAVS